MKEIVCKLTAVKMSVKQRNQSNLNLLGNQMVFQQIIQMQLLSFFFLFCLRYLRAQLRLILFVLRINIIIWNLFHYGIK